RGGGETVVEARTDAGALEGALREIPEVEEIRVQSAGDGYVRATVWPRVDQDLREAVAYKVHGHGWGLRELTRRIQSLEDVFVQLTTEDEEA
ncbi:MAG: hypothetical protein JO317_07135, partial [Verrucomicrobiae bacterium]|nr:hypothetical protein [Verrucomicrobiae bacterium]